MAAIPFNVSPGPDGSGDLIARLSRPGAASVQLQWLAPGEAFIVPENPSRIYIGFSLVSLNQHVTVTPGSTDEGCGFHLHRDNSIIEFGGGLISEMIRSEWKGVADGPSTLNIVVVNRT